MFPSIHQIQKKWSLKPFLSVNASVHLKIAIVLGNLSITATEDNRNKK